MAKTKIIKEYYENQLVLKTGPSSMGKTCSLRTGEKELSVKSLAKLFNEAAKDFDQLKPGDIHIQKDRITFSAKATQGALPASYKKLKPKTIGIQG